MACRLPGGIDDSGSLRRLLFDGVEAVRPVPPTARWNFEREFHPVPGESGRSYTGAAGYLDGDPLLFDAAFFGISPREAALIDPQQRLALELAWEALEDAGLRPDDLRGSSTGVSLGVASHDWGDLTSFDPGLGDFSFMSGVSTGIVANRVSHLFDLRGPSLCVDTACSSALTALDTACRWLREGEVALCLSGGVNLLLAPFLFRGLAGARMLSPSGRCHAFDARADGYVRGEGGVVVVLERLDRALARRRRILGVIRGMATGNDGWTPGLSLPSAASQETLIRRAIERAGADPGDVAYVEAHGTGTPVGDAVEAAAIGRALGFGREHALPIGSVKTNIGHLEAASAAAGLAKALIVVQTRRIPPSLNFRTPNPEIDFEALGIEVAATARTIAHPVPLVGLSSFGFGGSGGHLILEPPPEPSSRARPPGSLNTTILISARSAESLERRTQQITSLLDEDPGLYEDVAGCLAHHRQHLEFRQALWQDDQPGGTTQRSETPTRSTTGRTLEHRGVAFVFSGNGAQWPAMGRRLLADSSIFRNAVEEIDAILTELGVPGILAVLDGRSDLDTTLTKIAQPALLAFQVGVVRMLEVQGLIPQAVLGHSAGETAAAWASGALSLEDAVRTAAVRSRAQEATRGAGRMAAVALPWEAVAQRAGHAGLTIEIAAFNTPDSVTVTGPAGDVERLVKIVKADGGRATVLDLDYPFHGSAMDRCREPLFEGLAILRPGPCRIPMISTVTGDEIDGIGLEAEYWWRNTRNPVRFEKAVHRLADRDIGITVEIGPNPILGGYLRTVLGPREQAAVIPTVSPDDDGPGAVTAAVAAAWVHGAEVALDRLASPPPQPISLPPYPWDRTLHGPEPTEELIFDFTAPPDHPLLGARTAGGSDRWSTVLDPRETPWLGEHRVGGRPVLPGVAILETALAAVLTENRTIVVEDLALIEFLALEDDAGTTVETSLDEETGRLEIRFRRRLAGRPWTVAARGRVTVDPLRVPQWREHIEEVQKRRRPGGDPMAPVRRLEARGMGYGPSFRAISDISVADDAVIVEVEPPPSLEVADLKRYLIHPGLLDSCLQGAALLLHAGDDTNSELLVPARFRRVRFFPGGGPPRTALVRLTGRGTTFATLEINVVDHDGRAVLHIGQCRLEAVPTAAISPTLPLTVEAFEPIGAGQLNSSPTRIAVAVNRELGPVTEDQVEADALLLRFFQLAAHGLLRQYDDSGNSPVGPVREQLFEALTDSGLAREGPDGRPETIPLPEGFPDARSVWRTLFWRRPERGSTAILAIETVRRLEERLAGRESTDDSSAARNALAGVPEIRRCLQAVAAIINTVREACSPIRVLELEAGAGLITQSLLAIARSAEIYLAVDGADASLSWEERDWPWNAKIVRADEHRKEPAEIIVAGPHACGTMSPGGLTTRAAEDLVPGGILVAVALPARWPWGPISSAALGWIGITPDSWTEAVRAAGLEPVEIEGKTGAGPQILIARRPLEETSSVGFPQDDTEDRTLTLIALDHDKDMLQATAVALERRGATVRIAEPDAVEAGADLVAIAGSAAADVPESITTRLAALGTALERLGSAPGSLSIVIPGGRRLPDQPTIAGDAPIGAQTAFWAAARVLFHEYPGVPVRLLDIDRGENPETAAESLARELLSTGGEPEIVLRGDRRFAPRLISLSEDRSPVPAAPDDAVRFEPSLTTRHRRPRWRRADRPDPGPRELEIRVDAAGLNFRDAMLAVGMLPGEAAEVGAAGARLGMECAGTVTRVGPDVTGFRPGQRVLALGSGTLSRWVTVDAAMAVALKDEIPCAAAAGMPAVTLTVRYALDEVARLQSGEWILIHGGAGGVGLAAIQHAFERGARIIATAGTPTRRALLEDLGVDHAFDSRSGLFEPDVLEVTGGRGVDVVLNTLSGELLERSLGLLAPFGRFVELGKRDVFADRVVGLHALRSNGTLSVADSDSLMTLRPDLAHRILTGIGDDLENDRLRPLPYRVFEASRAADALETIRRGGHIGKLVVELTDPAPIENQPGEDLVERVVRTGAACLIVGGFGGIGLELGRWLVERGVETVVLAGRSGASPEARKHTADLSSKNTRVEAVELDVTDRDAVRTLISRFGNDFPPLGGLIHAAAFFGDRTLADLTPESIRAVVEPKVLGAELLDEALREVGITPEFLLLLSSMVTMLGNHGQGAYAAANAALEDLARTICERGGRALALALGPVAGVGLLQREEKLRCNLERKFGGRLLGIPEITAALDDLLREGTPAIVGLAASEISWADYADRLPGAVSRRLEPLWRGNEARDGRGGGIEAVLSLEPEAALEALTTMLRRLAGRVLRVEADGIDPNASLAEQGMDSLTAAEFQVELNALIGGAARPVTMASSLKISGLAREILGTRAPSPERRTEEILRRHGEAEDDR